MLPKDKAQYLINKFHSGTTIEFTESDAILAALICVDELIKECDEFETTVIDEEFNEVLRAEYWLEVKEELLKL